MTSGFDPLLLSRVEDAGINASAPPQQRWVDGWLVRFSPGKAKRARCINAVAPGRLSVEAKLELCRPIYAAAALPFYVRITPFSQPEGLDARLATLGMERQDHTCVMVVGRIAEAARFPLLPGYRLERLSHHAFADLVGGFRGSTLAERQAHGERLSQAPVPFQGYSLLNDEGVAEACGQFACEAELVGLYDVFTAPAHRGRGPALALCSGLIAIASAGEASVAYLQVEADNGAARRVYQRLGFSDAYAYHYRTPRAGDAKPGPRQG